jgi:hypothetical protein
MSNRKMRIAFTLNLALIIIYISHIHFNWTSLLIFVNIFWYVAHMARSLQIWWAKVKAFALAH